MADYGKNLKSAIKARNLSVPRLSRMTGIPMTTLYSGISRNNGVRYDHALIISDILRICPEEICGHTPASNGVSEKTAENIKAMLLQIRKDRDREQIKKCLEILKTYDEEHLRTVEELLLRFGRMDLANWHCMKEMMDAALRYCSVKPGEENMNWRKELEKPAGVADERNVADLSDTI